MLLDAADGELFPTTFVAYTVNVYVVLPFKPETEIGDVALEAVIPPGLETAV
jgi:hypothetical protein